MKKWILGRLRLKEEVTEDFIHNVFQSEKRIDAFLTDEYLEGKPLLPMIDETLDGFSTIPKLKQQRVHSIFTRLDDAQDNEDMLFILKQLAAEESLAPEQFEQLSELEQMDLPTIALVIKDTKVGQGLKFLPRKLTDLKQQLQIWLKYFVETGHSETRKQVAAVLEELLKRYGISLERYTNIKEDKNIL